MKVIIRLIIALTLLVCVLANSAEYAKRGSGGSKATSCRCGWRNHPKRRIVGGVESGVNEWPMIAALINMADETSGRQYCGSTIITNRHVISAAHCFRQTDPETQEQKPRDPNHIKVLVSAHDWTQITDVNNLLSVETFYIHEDYDQHTLYNDIAIATVVGKIPMSATVGPACFPQSRLNLNNVEVVAVGWGMTSWFGGDLGEQTTILRKVHLTLYDTQTCGDNTSLISTDYPHQVCTYNQGKSVCPGDSGGPILWYNSEINRYVIAGISSFVPYVEKGTGEGCQDLSGFTDPSAFIDWVQSKIGTEEVCHAV